jgi:hypothetical protein
MTRRASVVALVVIVGAILLSAASAGAHERPTPVVVSAAPGTHAIAASLTEVLVAQWPGPRLPAGYLVAVALLVLAVAWRPRRVVALGLIAIMAVLAFEIGVHTGHHLGKSEDAAHCRVAAASAKLTADHADATVDVPRTLLVAPAVAVPAPPVVVAATVAPHAGRAPPALAA